MEAKAWRIAIVRRRAMTVTIMTDCDLEGDLKAKGEEVYLYK